MLKLFERNTGMQSVIILAVVVLLWIPSIVHPIPLSPADGFAPLYALISPLSPILAAIIAMLLVIAAGFLLNIILVNTGLLPQNSMLPTLIYILYMSAGHPTLTPTLITGVLTIGVTFMLILPKGQITLPADRICGAGVIIGISSMFYAPSLALLITYMLTAVNYRLYRWKDMVLILLGLLAPYLLYWTIMFLSGTLAESFETLWNSIKSITWHTGDYSSLAGVANILLAVIFLAALLILWGRLGEKTVNWQKNKFAFKRNEISLDGAMNILEKKNSL